VFLPGLAYWAALNYKRRLEKIAKTFFNGWQTSLEPRGKFKLGSGKYFLKASINDEMIAVWEESSGGHRVGRTLTFS